MMAVTATLPLQHCAFLLVLFVSEKPHVLADASICGVFLIL